MVIAVEDVAKKYLSVSAGTPISVTIPAFEVTDVFVYYGNASVLAVQGEDYTVALQPDEYDTFIVTPTASLLTKINDLIAGDVTETNFIVVRRQLDLTTTATAAAVRDTPFTSREFDRTVMRDQQFADALARAIVLDNAFAPPYPNLRVQNAPPDLVESYALVSLPGGGLGFGPTATDIADAAENAATALDAANDAEAAAAAAAASAASINPATLVNVANAQTITGAKTFSALLAGAAATFSQLVTAQMLKVRGLINVAAGVNVDTVTDGGRYYLQPGVVSGPDAAQGWFMTVDELSGNDLLQKVDRHASNNGQSASRTRLAGVWSKWFFKGARDGTAVMALPSLALLDFTQVPIYATEVNLHIFSASSTHAGIVNVSLRLRAQSAGPVTAGYSCSNSVITLTPAVGAGNAVTDRIPILSLLNGADNFVGLIEMKRVSDTNRWTVTARGRRGDADNFAFGTVDLGANPLNGFQLILDTGTYDLGNYAVDWRT